MKTRPILFSAPMVRALLDCSKTQTRRPVKPAPEMVAERRIEPWTGDPSALLQLLQASKRPCPYGGPGNRMWVRETFLAYGRWETRFSAKKARDEWHFVDMATECDRAYQFAADNPDLVLAAGRGGALPGWYKRPAIFMPRAASRILLEIVSVRVERLNDCSEADALAEGVKGEPCDHIRLSCEEIGCCGPTAKGMYAALWNQINGASAWAANPWVWVIEFKRVTP